MFQPVHDKSWYKFIRYFIDNIKQQIFGFAVNFTQQIFEFISLMYFSIYNNHILPNILYRNLCLRTSVENKKDNFLYEWVKLFAKCVLNICKTKMEGEVKWT